MSRTHQPPLFGPFLFQSKVFHFLQLLPPVVFCFIVKIKIIVVRWTHLPYLVIITFDVFSDIISHYASKAQGDRDITS